MRVISQDGMQDIPYNKFVFSITKDNRIVATMADRIPASFYTGSKSDDYTEIEQAVGKD